MGLQIESAGESLTGDDDPAPHFPRLQVGGDEALAHDGLQNLGKHALVVVERILLGGQQGKACSSRCWSIISARSTAT